MPASSPCAEIRNGYPQVIANTVPLNWMVKWLHMPSRGARLLPGTGQGHTGGAQALRVAPAGVCRGGTSCSSRTTRTTATPDSPASDRKAGVQPAECRTKANGTTLSSCPSCPDIPVSWVSSGTRAGANHSGISRMTEMNVMASPAPTRTRPSTPAGTLSAKASWSWPSPMSRAPPAIMAREPNLSTSTPTGIWSPA